MVDCVCDPIFSDGYRYNQFIGSYFKICAYSPRDIIGFCAGMLNIAIWMGAQSPQLVETYKNKSGGNLSLSFLLIWLAGDISNLFGCIFTHQSKVQLYTAIYFLIMDSLVLLQIGYYAYLHDNGQQFDQQIVDDDDDQESSFVQHHQDDEQYDQNEEYYDDIEDDNYEQQQICTVEPFPTKQLNHEQHQQQQQQHQQSVFAKSVVVPPNSTSSGSSKSRRRTNKNASTPIASVHSINSNYGSIADNMITPITFPEPQTSSADNNRVSPLQQQQQQQQRRVSGGGGGSSSFGSSSTFLTIIAAIAAMILLEPVASLPSRLVDIQLLPTSLVPSKSSLLDVATHTAMSSLSQFTEGPPICDHTIGDNHIQHIIGTISAWACGLLYFASRVPQAIKNYQEKTVQGLSFALFSMSFTANVFYAISILLPTTTNFMTIGFWRDTFPYLVGSLGANVFGLFIMFQFCWYRKSPQTEALLAAEQDKNDNNNTPEQSTDTTIETTTTTTVTKNTNDIYDNVDQYYPKHAVASQANVSVSHSPSSSNDLTDNSSTNHLISSQTSQYDSRKSSDGPGSNTDLTFSRSENQYDNHEHHTSMTSSPSSTNSPSETAHLLTK